jgi:uncharacterized repeat protein (TIGR03803 family)
LSIGLRAASSIFALILLATGAWAAPQETVLYSFGAMGDDGSTPAASLIFDASGNLYGTTWFGGNTVACSGGCGTVFELSPTAGGGWTETVLHRFNGTDGDMPLASLIFDGSGNLYGTTFHGGTSVACGGGCGTVFELSPKTGGGWTEKVLHNFNFNGKDGADSYASLIFDASGNLYGTTFYGGRSTACNGGCGTVFELSPKTGGGWTEKILHSFGGSSKDGHSPVASLIFDSFGNLYGTARDGGVSFQGTVFELTPKSGGGWTEKTLYNFKNNGRDGLDPGSSLLFDSSGNLYGTTFFGSRYGNGLAFELTPRSGGGWAEKHLHGFGANNTYGVYPYGLISDAAGNLYGTTSQDNVGGGGGTVFELMPKAGGGWTQKVLYHFVDPATGYSPYCNLILDAAGNLYGTTQGGGAFGAGTVFKITP